MTEELINKITTAFKAGGAAIIADDSERVMIGILVTPAVTLGEPLLNKMLHLSKGGTTQVALSPVRAEAFELEPMGFNLSNKGVKNIYQRSPRQLVSVEAREGVTSGISIADRSLTVRLLGETPQPKNIVKPGHIFPIQTREGGVLVKSSLPEAALDLVRLTGFTDAACFLEILDNYGEHLNDAALKNLAQTENIPLITISDIISHRLKNENLIYQVAKAKLPSSYGGELTSYLYRSDVYQGEHLALVKGDNFNEKEVLVRVQPENTFIDVFGDMSCGRNSYIAAALKAIGDSSAGIFIYLRRTEDNPLATELHSSLPPASGGASMKEYGIGAQILKSLGAKTIRLLANNKTSLSGLSAYGLKISGYQQLPNETEQNLDSKK
jgi:3,4-dihydroxy 2-butanone 4-phosphate synthase/GTP cyclohydrolase II